LPQDSYINTTLEYVLKSSYVRIVSTTRIRLCSNPISYVIYVILTRDQIYLIYHAFTKKR